MALTANLCKNKPLCCLPIKSPGNIALIADTLVAAIESRWL
jgi:hypothetical protein